jgi:hypothetical protein
LPWGEPGEEECYATVASRAATGARLWARHYQNLGADQAGAVAVAVSRAGLLFVTGTSRRVNGDGDYATIGYRG